MNDPVRLRWSASHPTFAEIVRLMRQGFDSLDIARKFHCRESFVWNSLKSGDLQSHQSTPPEKAG